MKTSYAGIISSLDLYRIENHLHFLAYQIKTGDIDNIILTGGEKFIFYIVPSKWKNYIQYNIMTDTRNSKKMYLKNTVWYGNEVNLADSHGIKADIGYEDYKVYEGEGSVNQLKSKLEYIYTF